MKVVIGQGSCGVATGAKKTAAEFEKVIAEKGLDIAVDITGCVGTCYLEPIVDIYDDNGEMTRNVKVQPDKVEKIVEEHLIGGKAFAEQAISDEDKQFVEKQQRVVLRNCGVINPENIEEYIAADGYKAIEKVLKEMKPRFLHAGKALQRFQRKFGQNREYKVIRYIAMATVLIILRHIFTAKYKIH